MWIIDGQLISHNMFINSGKNRFTRDRKNGRKGSDHGGGGGKASILGDGVVEPDSGLVQSSERVPRRGLLRRSKTLNIPTMCEPPVSSQIQIGNCELGTTTPEDILTGIAHNVFTIHFEASKKSFILSDTLRSATLSSTLGRVCNQRGIDMEKFLPQDLNGKILLPHIRLGDIPGGEVLFYKPSNEKFRDIDIYFMDEEVHQVARIDPHMDVELSTFLESEFKIQADEVTVELSSGIKIPMDAKMKDITELCIFKKKVDDPEGKKIQKKKFGARINVFSDSLKGVPEEVVTKRRELLGDVTKKSLLLSTKPLLLAQALTLIEHELFMAIPETELFGARWKKEEKEKLTPNVVNMINWFNQTTNWIKTQILLGLTPKERGIMIEKLISVAGYCQLLNNYNTVIEIVSSLGGQAIRRLKLSWDEISIEFMEKWENILTFFSPETNYTKLRDAHVEILAGTSDPLRCASLPYIGIILEDLLKLEEIPNVNSRVKQVNWAKMQKISGQFHLVRSLQSKRYNFVIENVEEIQELIYFLTSDGLAILPEKEQGVWSKLLEESPKRKTTGVS
eukprot:TRINITY_DN1469_c0_g1_i2.p1 TRINITY_DN1469_c0_g1~~TRINITY_DN1469_c0_g1_i2.p1  ORF type:complete len:565 (+),score=149.88 TRINITY_DN1469_c0_g1_i2:1837-3531(+)